MGFVASRIVVWLLGGYFLGAWTFKEAVSRMMFTSLRKSYQYLLPKRTTHGLRYGAPVRQGVCSQGLPYSWVFETPGTCHLPDDQGPQLLQIRRGTTNTGAGCKALVSPSLTIPLALVSGNIRSTSPSWYDYQS